MKKNFDNYLITDEKSQIDFARVCFLLGSSYWASKRPEETIAKSIENSICVIVLHDGQQVGFARVVTDKATFSWIADVIVDEDHRNRGIGKAMMQFIQEHPDIPASIQFLVTKDAHGLYEKYGFQRDECMVKRIKPS